MIKYSRWRRGKGISSATKFNQSKLACQLHSWFNTIEFSRRFARFFFSFAQHMANTRKERAELINKLTLTTKHAKMTCSFPDLLYFLNFHTPSSSQSSEQGYAKDCWPFLTVNLPFSGRMMNSLFSAKIHDIFVIFINNDQLEKK